MEELIRTSADVYTALYVIWWSIVSVGIMFICYLAYCTYKTHKSFGVLSTACRTMGRGKKDRLIKLATETYGVIEPVSTKTTLDECFTEEGDTMFFWFNTKDKSTHLLSE